MRIKYDKDQSYLKEFSETFKFSLIQGGTTNWKNPDSIKKITDYLNEKYNGKFFNTTAKGSPITYWKKFRKSLGDKHE